MADTQLYTMRQAAQRKGVSYHTVSRAIRSGRVPSQRLGRQVFITPANLDAWEPMREKAPRKYRRKEPDLQVIASSLTQDSLDRATLEATLTELASALVRAAGSLTLEQLRDVNQYLSDILRDSAVARSASPGSSATEA